MASLTAKKVNGRTYYYLRETRRVNGIERQFFGYHARGAPYGPDDGTLAPWVAVASLPFAPEIVIPTIRAMARLELGATTRYGFKPSFNQTYAVPDSPTDWWVTPHHFGIDQGPVALMIEKAPAVENLEALLAVPGVDMVQFGPADYAMSLGIPGQWDHPKVKEAERHVIATALKMGIAPRAEIAHPDDAGKYLDMGVKHFCIGWDVGILFNWWKTNGKAMREILGHDAGEAEGASRAKTYPA